MPKGPERGLLHLRQGKIVSEPYSLYKAASPEPRCVRFAAGIPHSHMAGLDLKKRLIFLVGSIPPLATIPIKGLRALASSSKSLPYGNL